MKTFLEYVAQDILKKYGSDLSHVAVVFPNKRAALFLNEHLVKLAGKPIWSPAYITISELFRRHSQKTVADSIKLVCDLHKCYTQCTGSTESLDRFYSWGELMIADFDDIDKNMARADKVLANVRDLHEMDDVSYLTPEQKEMIKTFFSNFNDEHNSELKRRFLNMWSRLYDIYSSFNDMLDRQGLAYEGALYRSVAEDESVKFDYDTYIFVGFNMLQKVEQRLFTRLKKEGKARFYWDFDNYYMTDRLHRQGTRGGTHHEAGHYIAAYLEDYPNELDCSDDAIYGNFRKHKDITFISASTENIQARYVSQWLKENGRADCGRRTAVVMCDENLLTSVIHCLPEEVQKVNITTGWQLSLSPMASLLTLLTDMQTNGYIAHAEKYRLQNVNAILRHPYMKFISPDYNQLYIELNVNSRIYYPSREVLATDKGTALLFTDIYSYDSDTLTGKIVKWLIAMVKLVASNAGESDDQLFKEAIFRCFTLLNRLEALIDSGDLIVDVLTLQRLLGQLMSSTAIPFHGEPAEGIQVMGVLETRNIDFDHVLLLSANEGNMPKGVNDTSLIPYSIRKAHELTTIDNKVAIFAYYFYRLLQRASDVTIIYNTSTENGSTGEMSRFMLQMLVESGHNISRNTLTPGQQPKVFVPEAVEKTAEMVTKMMERFEWKGGNDKLKPLLTPTAINRYIRCGKLFYYNYVCGIWEPDDNDNDEIDNRLFGNIFHDSAQLIYERLTQRGPHIHKKELEWLLTHDAEIERIVDRVFCEELFHTTPENGTGPEYNGLQLINREVIITYLKRLLKIDMQLAPFDIVGLETDVVEMMDITAGKLSFTTTVGGRIDRLDSVNDGSGERIRVIDYKTGSKNGTQLADIGDIFSKENIRKHSDYYLQTFLYSKIVSESAKDNPRRLPVSPALLFIQHAAGQDYDPTLCLSKIPVRDIKEHSGEFMAQLKSVVGEIFDTTKPFLPSGDESVCAQCVYRQICGEKQKE